MKHTINLLVSLASFSWFAIAARADVVPPDTAACSGKQAGAACTYSNAAGTCQNGTCGRTDYANWDRDASASPPTTTYACLKCTTVSVTATLTETGSKTETGTGTDTTTVTGAPTATGSDTQTTTAAPTATVTTTTTATTTATTTTDPPTATASGTATGTKNDEPPADDDGACSIGRGSTAKRIAPWLLAASFSLLFLWGRRRRS